MIFLLLALLADPFEVVDLSHPLGPHTPTFGGKPQFSAREVGGPNYSVKEVELNEHTGTHVDAPAHFIKGALSVDSLSVRSLVAPAVVVDVRKQCENNPDYRVTAADLQAWEKAHGKIPFGALVIAVTGWSVKWINAKMYRGVDDQNMLHFPGFGEDAVDWLIANRQRIAGLAIDTLSVDYGPSAKFEVHKKSHAAGWYHVENLDRPERLPAKGATVVVGVIPFVGGSGAPARVIALLPPSASHK